MIILLRHRPELATSTPPYIVTCKWGKESGDEVDSQENIEVGT